MPAAERAAPRIADLFAEAERQLAVCNSCRYCAGFCPVWPELELRTVLRTGDVTYLANLCHDCQDCFTACMYTAPHEFDLNPPKVFAQVREQTYRHYVWPRRLPGLLASWWGVAGAYLGTCALLVLLATLTTGHPAATPGSPYRLLPYPVMLAALAAPALYSAAVLAAGALRFWRAIGGSWPDLFRVRPWPATLVHGVQLRHMRGGGAGCDYPASAPSAARRRFHLATVYGFGLCTVSTVVAALQQDVLGLAPPYPYLSVPVVTGTVGGLGMLVGGTGLLALKSRSDPARTTARMRHADVGFLWALLVLAASGLVTLALRGGALFGPVLVAHLAAVALAFAIAPYTKFAHWIYRLLAIHKHNVEGRAAQ